MSHCTACDFSSVACFVMVLNPFLSFLLLVLLKSCIGNWGGGGVPCSISGFFIRAVWYHPVCCSTSNRAQSCTTGTARVQATHSLVLHFGAHCALHIVCCMVHTICSMVHTECCIMHVAATCLHIQQQQLLMSGQVVDQYSSDSFWLLALALGVIPDVHKVDLLRLT